MKLPHLNNFNITILPKTEKFLLRAETIAVNLGGKVSRDSSHNHEIDKNLDILIFIDDNGISIKSSANSREKPVYIDFASNKMLHRTANISSRKESIARAVGLKSGENISVLDTTTGRGTDSFILAALGAHVTMLERNPFVHLLLEDALARAENNVNLAAIIKRMGLIFSDAINFIDNVDLKQDVIYIDPMFPQKTKTALANKEMRLFKIIAGKDEDAEILFTKALTLAGKRVVVKRPGKSDYMLNIKPAFSTAGKASRFDVYINH